jgi:hypothetical protein
MLNKVTKKECMEAIEYLFTMGYTLEMTSDKRYYTEILLKKVANEIIKELFILHIQQTKQLNIAKNAISVGN